MGAQKCGTSWCAAVLAQHPRIFLPRKEINFFVRHFHRGYGWYHRWFEERGDRVAGEITPNYLYSPRPDAARKQFYPRYWPRDVLLFWRRHPSAAEEIARHYPDARIFAIFRNPIERAWSHYWMWRNRKERIGKGRRVVSFERMFRDDGRWIRTQGAYGALLAPWLERFPDMGLFFHDDVVRDPLAVARALYRFVGVDPAFEPETARNPNPGRYPPMPEPDRALAAEAYRDDLVRFSELVGRDCTVWLQGRRLEPAG